LNGLDGPIAPTLGEAAQFELLRLLGSKPRTSQREAASFLGVSLGKANYCLRALIAKGLVKVENYRGSDNKLAYLYLLTPTGMAAKAQLTRDFLAWKMDEYEDLRAEIDRLRLEAEEGN
jgi:EPS-associated MarR family transcriptional regulator